MSNYPPFPKRDQRGFSLVEIMVGMVIGMIGIIIIMQVTSVFEARKRTTSSGDDAQNIGAITLSSIQKELSQAGYGLSVSQLIGRPLTIPASGARPALPLGSLQPVTINPAVLAAAVGFEAANTADMIMLIYGNSNNVEGTVINNSTATLPYEVSLGAGVGAQTDGGRGYTVGDYVIPSQSGVTNPHNIYRVITSAASNVVAVTPGPTAQDTLWYIPGGGKELPVLFNLGSSPSMPVFAVINAPNNNPPINHALGVCDYFRTDCANVANWTQLAGDVYAFHAACASTTSVRIVLVTRNAQYDPNQVTATMPTWINAAGLNTNMATPTANGTWDSTLAPDGNPKWQHYRYKTFESIVPLRNAIWSGVSGCV